MFGLYNKTIYLMCICGKQAVIVIRYNVHPTHILDDIPPPHRYKQQLTIMRWFGIMHRSQVTQPTNR